MQQADLSRARMVRVFDAIAYAILASAVIICHPRIGTTPLGDLANLHLIPVLGLAVATFCLHAPADAPEKWQHALWRLKLAIMIALGLAPFVSWWLRTSDNLHLALMGAAAISASIWYLLELAALLRVVFRHYADRHMEAEAKIARLLFIYLDLVPVLAVYVAFLAAVLLYPGTVLADLRRAWAIVPPILRCVMLLPVLNIVRLLWGSHRVIRQGGDNPHEEDSVLAPLP